MSAQVPQLFDPVKVRMALNRAQRQGVEPFLLERASDDLIERLVPVLRDFETVLDIGTPGNAFSQALIRSGRVAPHAAKHIGAEDIVTLPVQSACLITSGMAFQQINDLPGLLVQLNRALKPDGLLLACFPGGDTLRELRDVLLRAESEITGAAALRVFPMIDVRAAGQLLQRAGFALPVVDSEKVTVRYATIFSLFKDLRAMGATAASLNRQAPPLTRAILMRAAELYAHDYADVDGKIRATFEFIWISGWAPHESQQKPLKPGSAKTRLADALTDMARGNAKTSEN